MLLALQWCDKIYCANLKCNYLFNAYDKTILEKHPSKNRFCVKCRNKRMYITDVGCMICRTQITDEGKRFKLYCDGCTKIDQNLRNERFRDARKST